MTFEERKAEVIGKINRWITWHEEKIKGYKLAKEVAESAKDYETIEGLEGILK